MLSAMCSLATFLHFCVLVRSQLTVAITVILLCFHSWSNYSIAKGRSRPCSSRFLSANIVIPGDPLEFISIKKTYVVQLKLYLISYLLEEPPAVLSFCWPDGAPIKRNLFVEQLNRALRVCKLDPALYKSQSFRIGAATWAAAKVLPTHRFAS